MAAFCLAGCAPAAAFGSGADLDSQNEAALRNDRAKLESAELLARGTSDEIAKAERLYREVIAGPRRVDTLLIPVDGAIVSENAAIGPLPFWPRSVAEIQYYSPLRVDAIIGLCALEASGSECTSARIGRLVDLVLLEGNFATCRIRAQWGGSSSNPYSFSFGLPVDFDRQIETRNCIFAEPRVVALSAAQTRALWSLWLALDRVAECRAEKCRGADPVKVLESMPDKSIPDSLTSFAARDALGQSPSMDNQVGDSWWRRSCRMFRVKDGPPPRPSEQEICSLIYDKPKED